MMPAMGLGCPHWGPFAALWFTCPACRPGLHYLVLHLTQCLLQCTGQPSLEPLPELLPADSIVLLSRRPLERWLISLQGPEMVPVVF